MPPTEFSTCLETIAFRQRSRTARFRCRARAETAILVATPMSPDDKYLVLLRRELTRAQARLTRAERERDAALAENRRLKEKLGRRRARAPRKLSRA
jgi:hypothetical protein